MALFERKFLQRMGGALMSGLVDAGIEAVFASDPTKYAEKFPYVTVITPILPPADDWIVTGVSAAPYVIGLYTRKEMVKTIGEGMVFYSVPMMIHHTIHRAKWMVAT